MTSKSFKATIIPGLRSPYDEVNGLVYFPRMISKIRLFAEGKLSEAYLDHLGGGFDGVCARFLGVDYDAVKTEVLHGAKSDEELLEWCFQNGHPRNTEEIKIWSGFLKKCGWRDSVHALLVKRLREAGLPEDGSIETIFDLIDVDEGRSLREW